MEMFLMRESLSQNISMARFANVAFSDGSLLHGFNQRFAKQTTHIQPQTMLNGILLRLRNQVSFALCHAY